MAAGSVIKLAWLQVHCGVTVGGGGVRGPYNDENGCVPAVMQWYQRPRSYETRRSFWYCGRQDRTAWTPISTDSYSQDVLL